MITNSYIVYLINNDGKNLKLFAILHHNFLLNFKILILITIRFLVAFVKITFYEVDYQNARNLMKNDIVIQVLNLGGSCAF